MLFPFLHVGCDVKMTFSRERLPANHFQRFAPCSFPVGGAEPRFGQTTALETPKSRTERLAMAA